MSAASKIQPPKPPAPAPQPAPVAVAKSTLTGAQKSAILMVILGEQVSSEVLRQLNEDEVESIGGQIANIPTITSVQSEEVLTEFYQMLVARDYVLKGGIEYARRILINAFGAEQAQRLTDRFARTAALLTSPFDALEKADPQQLASFIRNEHPQTVALILSHLGPAKAAALLTSLPPPLRADVAVRMANLDQISPEVMSKIAEIVGQKLKALVETTREVSGGVRAVAEMFNSLDQKTSKEILSSIEGSDEPLGEKIRHFMFVFDDLLQVNDAGIRELLARVDRKMLTVALKGTSEALKTHFLQTMSQRGAEMLREDMEALGPIRLREVLAAQQQIIAAVRLLEAEGAITIKASGGADEYVS